MQSLVQRGDLAEKLAELTKPVEEMEEGLLASATYDGDRRLAVLKFYDQKKGRFWLWRDNTGHKPYCVEGDTLLLGDNTRISEIAQGNQVLGLSGEVRVEGKTDRPYTGSMIRVQACGLLPFNITPEHPILVARSRTSSHSSPAGFDDPCWKNPSDLQSKTSRNEGDYLVMPIAKPRFGNVTLPLASFSKMRSGWLKVKEVPLNDDTAWLLGLYVAEGSSGGRRGAVFSLNKCEQSTLHRIRRIANGIGYSSYLVDNGRRSIRIHVGGSVLARALDEWCGHGARNKRIPDFILFHTDITVLRSFLEGYSAGDGSTGISGRTKSRKEVEVMSSVSKLLVLQLQQAYARLGIFARITLQHKEGDYTIEGRRVHQKEAYTIRFVKRPKYTWSKRVGNYFYVPVRRAESIKFSGRVFNIQTSDNTYLVNNVVVHNCYTRLGSEELDTVRTRKDVVEIIEEEKLDLLNDGRVVLRKIVATDPLAIGGGTNSIRDQIKAWEADIKYYENYAYDRGLKMGTYYSVSAGKVSPLKHEVPQNVAMSLEAILKKNPPEFAPYLKEWAELLGEPLVEFRRVAMDIEVANEEGRMPDPEDPTQPVISVSFVNEDERLVYALRKEGPEPKPSDYKLELFDDETDLIRAVFLKMMDYPVIITFNGDNFDLRYLKHRADKRKIPEEEDPIELQRVESSLKHGIHLDLYNFFKNRSIQVYAFSNKYSDYTLNTISEALIGKSKIEFEGNVGDLPLEELAKYNLNDSQLTYELTSMGGSVAMKLLLVIARIGKMPMNDVGRLGVSNWIRSMLFFEHRKLGALIPRPDELAEKGGASSQAIIKGKKYKGGLVIEPTPGVYFDVSVFDFASLYPSLIKVHNLSYETVNCPHPECRTNTVPDTASWVCRKRKGVTSLVIGSLRDLRVSHYKPLAKNPSLTKTDSELYNVVSQGLKVFLNATYGSFGFESFAFYCLPVAEATAALGRFAITKTIERCNQLGIKVLYSDTDSLFLQNPSKEQTSTLTKWAEDELGIELDLDKSYRYVAFSSRKKNYFGVFPDGTVDIRGLTGKKSVDGATPMIARFDDRIQLTTVSGVYEAFKKGKAVEVITVVDGLNTAWVHISNAMRHKVDDAYRVSTSKGRELTLSGDHSVYLIDTFGQLNCRETRLLKPGDVVVGAQYVPPRSPSDCIVAPHYITSRVRLKDGKVYSGKLHATVGVPIPFKLPLSPDLGFLLGIYTSEGNTARREGSRNNSITQNRVVNPEVCAEIDRAWRDVFLRPAKVYSRRGGVNSYYLPKLHAELFENLCGGTSGVKRVPEVAFDADDGFVSAFLRAVFSGDGYGDGRRVNLASKSRTLLTGVAYLLARFDIDCRIRRLRVKRKTYHQLSVIGAYSRRRFYHFIGFLQPRFNKEVKTGPRNKELIPITTEGLLSLKKAMALRRHARVLKGVEMHDRRYYNLSMLDKYNAIIGSLVQVAGLDERRALAAIATMLNVRDVSYDEVISVRRLRGRRTMFDFSVPCFERFVAGNLPTLLHNSQTPEYLKQTFYKALEILSSVRSPDDFERARARTRELLTTMVLNLKGKRVPVVDLAFNVMMGKPTSKYNGTKPQHVRAAEALEQKGREIKAGDIIGYVKTKSAPYVKPVEHAKADDIDPDKYIEYAHSMFDQMLDALDFSFDEIMGATTLESFWS